MTVPAPMGGPAWLRRVSACISRARPSPGLDGDHGKFHSAGPGLEAHAPELIEKAAPMRGDRESAIASPGEIVGAGDIHRGEDLALAGHTPCIFLS